MTTQYSKEFGNIICFNINNIINRVIEKTNLTHDQIIFIFNDLVEYSKEFIDYLYQYRYNIDNIDDNNINFTSNIRNDNITNNITYIQHMVFLIFTYFRDNNFNITDIMKNNIIDIFIDIIVRII